MMVEVRSLCGTTPRSISHYTVSKQKGMLWKELYKEGTMYLHHIDKLTCHHINQNWVLCLSQVVVLLIKEGRVLFNDALNTFYLWLYGVGHIVKNHSDSERGNPLPPLRLFFLNSSKGSFYMHHPTNRIAHTMVFVTPVVEHWLEREIAQWVHHEGSIQRPIAP